MLIAYPVILLFALAGAPTPEGGVDGVLAAGGTLGLGVAMGAGYQLFRLTRRRARAIGGGSATSTKTTIPTSVALLAGGSAVLVRALIPDVFGWDFGLMAPMFGCGLLLPGLPGFVIRVFKEERAARA